MARPVVNLPASVRQRLLNLSRQRKEDFSAILNQYVIERLLYRLAKSSYADQFVLKGAVLFTIWTGQPHRPTLLDFPSPHLRAYPRDTVVAEKLEALVALGELNSRMKDFYDLWTLARLFAFDGVVLARAISATFNRRQNEIPDGVPIALTPEFGKLPDKTTQWEAFLRRNRLNEGPPPLLHIIVTLETFLVLPLLAVANDRPFEKHWPPGGPWREGRLTGEADAAAG